MGPAALLCVASLVPTLAGSALDNDNIKTAVALWLSDRVGDSNHPRRLGSNHPRRLGATFDQFKLTASDAAADDSFGWSVAIDGDTVVVGAFNDGNTGAGKWDGAGSVYVYRTSDGGATYDEVAKLTAADAASRDYFGYSVAIDGDTIVVGAPWKDAGEDCTYDGQNWNGEDCNHGALYVFRTSDGGATYGQVAKLMGSDTANGDHFGSSVAIDGDTIVIGAYGDDDGGTRSGSAFVFRTTDGGATYVELAKLTADDVAVYDNFGFSVAIDGATIVVGANQRNNGGSGSVYVFSTSDGGATYVEVAKLTAADAAAWSGFGTSVAIDGDTIVAGTLDNGAEAAYVFGPSAPTTQPTPQPTLQPVPRPTPAPSTPQPTSAPSITPQPTLAPIPQPTSAPSPQPTLAPVPQPTPAPSSAGAFESDAATRAGPLLALLAAAATVLAL